MKKLVLMEKEADIDRGQQWGKWLSAARLELDRKAGQGLDRITNLLLQLVIIFSCCSLYSVICRREKE